METKKEVCYYCEKELEEGGKRFYVIIQGEMRRVHQRCYKRATADKTNIRMIVK